MYLETLQLLWENNIYTFDPNIYINFKIANKLLDIVCTRVGTRCLLSIIQFLMIWIALTNSTFHNPYCTILTDPLSFHRAFYNSTLFLP